MELGKSHKHFFKTTLSELLAADLEDQSIMPPTRTTLPNTPINKLMLKLLRNKTTSRLSRSRLRLRPKQLRH
jgi:hypothetical protein